MSDENPENPETPVVSLEQHTRLLEDVLVLNQHLREAIGYINQLALVIERQQLQINRLYGSEFIENKVVYH